MTPAERAALMGLADEFQRRSLERYGNPYADGCGIAYAICADELRALLAELERE